MRKTTTLSSSDDDDGDDSDEVQDLFEDRDDDEEYGDEDIDDDVPLMDKTNEKADIIVCESKQQRGEIEISIQMQVIEVARAQISFSLFAVSLPISDRDDMQVIYFLSYFVPDPVIINDTSPLTNDEYGTQNPCGKGIHKCCWNKLLVNDKDTVKNIFLNVCYSYKDINCSFMEKVGVVKEENIDNKLTEDVMQSIMKLLENVDKNKNHCEDKTTEYQGHHTVTQSQMNSKVGCQESFGKEENTLQRSEDDKKIYKDETTDYQADIEIGIGNFDRKQKGKKKEIHLRPKELKVDDVSKSDLEESDISGFFYDYGSNRVGKRKKNESLGINIDELEGFYSLPGRHLSSGFVSPASAPLLKLMSCELMRLRSFDHWSNQNASAMVLARSGFFFSKPEMKVICFSCNVTIENFSPEIEIDSLHAKNCPRSSFNVPLAQGTGTFNSADLQLFDSVYDDHSKDPTVVGAGVNVTSSALDSNFQDSSTSTNQFDSSASRHTISQASESSSNEQVVYVLTSATPNQPVRFKPFSSTLRNQDNSSCSGMTIDTREGRPLLDLSGAAYPLFANPKMRQGTFQSWDPSHTQRPERLVKLGFFFAGYSDCARCFYCGLGLKYWRPQDNAAYQHARFRPQCLYNRFLNGQDFVDRVQREVVMESQTQTPDTAPSSNTDTRREDTMLQPSMERLMNTEAAKRVLEEGWSIQTVRLGLEKLVADLGEECLVYDILLEVLNNIESVESDSVSATVQSAHEQLPQREIDVPDGLSHLLVRSKSETSTKVGTREEVSLNSNTVFSLLEREHDYLKKRILCKVCNQEKIGCIYLPCGHVIACQKCGELATNCLLCNKVISATANTFIS